MKHKQDGRMHKNVIKMAEKVLSEVFIDSSGVPKRGGTLIYFGS